MIKYFRVAPGLNDYNVKQNMSKTFDVFTIVTERRCILVETTTDLMGLSLLCLEMFGPEFILFKKVLVN